MDVLADTEQASLNLRVWPEFSNHWFQGAVSVHHYEVWCRNSLEHDRPGRVLLPVAELPVNDVLAVVDGQGTETVEVRSVQHQVTVFLAGGFKKRLYLSTPVRAAMEGRPGGASFLD